MTLVDEEKPGAIQFYRSSLELLVLERNDTSVQLPQRPLASPIDGDRKKKHKIDF
jgi:hypothetical protein